MESRSKRCFLNIEIDPPSCWFTVALGIIHHISNFFAHCESTSRRSISMLLFELWRQCCRAVDWRHGFPPLTQVAFRITEITAILRVNWSTYTSRPQSLQICRSSFPNNIKFVDRPKWGITIVKRSIGIPTILSKLHLSRPVMNVTLPMGGTKHLINLFGEF